MVTFINMRMIIPLVDVGAAVSQTNWQTQRKILESIKAWNGRPAGWPGFVFVCDDFGEGCKQTFAYYGLAFEREMRAVAEQHRAAGLLIPGGIVFHIMRVGNGRHHSLQTRNPVAREAVRTMATEDERG